jgi:AAA+ ATPase superfamily predicted ATPase
LIGCTCTAKILQKYYLRDNFLSFWFRFIYRNLSAVETGNVGYVREIIERDYATWSGKILERFFHDLYAASGKYNQTCNIRLSDCCRNIRDIWWNIML